MKNIKIWFNNGKSRNLECVTEMTRSENVMVIQSDNREYMINWDNVSMIEEY